MDPRISFSNDFVDTQHTTKYANASSYREEPVSSDFEFYVKKDAMVPADEIFSKGVMMPLKDNCNSQLRKLTLREELLVDDDAEFDDSLRRVPKNSGRWRDRLGLKRAHIVPRKSGRSNDVLERDDKRSIVVHKERLAVGREHR